MSFPLYDVLIKDVSDNELTREEKTKLMSIIPTLDQKGQDNMYTLIRVHGLKTKAGGNIFEIPYDGQNVDKMTTGKNTRDIKFNIDKLPPTVAQLIYKFAMIHIDTMSNDERILRLD
ncbi:MAG: hypothetical protein PHG66_06095 [Candidatus Colwellbacteria bacterium]|nr:hypothetical protein [Candidatus Colwellbacteria bacterium]